MPPYSVGYPYVIVNASHPEVGLRYLRRWGGIARFVIVDAGVEVFRRLDLDDYPEGWEGRVRRVLEVAEEARRLAPRAEVRPVVPDYPSDYLAELASWRGPARELVEGVERLAEAFGDYAARWFGASRREAVERARRALLRAVACGKCESSRVPALIAEATRRREEVRLRILVQTPSARMNVERTLAAVERALERWPDVPWIVPVQGRYRDPASPTRSLELYAQRIDLSRVDYVAIANLCVERNAWIIIEAVRRARKWLASHRLRPRIHCFGLKLTAAKALRHDLDSFDSVTHTRPRSRELHELFPWSAKNEAQHILFFIDYIDELQRWGIDAPNPVIE